MAGKLTRGLVQVYTGDGKGKTTAALGLAFRALGHGFRVFIIQFMKGSSYYGELMTAQKFYPQLEIRQYGRNCPYDAQIRQGETTCQGCGSCFVKKGEATDRDRELAGMALAKAAQILQAEEHDLVILDEIFNAHYFELVKTEQIIDLINLKPEKVELIMTGRNTPPEIAEQADLITEMKMIKHPFNKGVPARRGIEY